MDHKLIGTAVGFFGFGAVVSWALTADIYTHRLRVSQSTESVLTEAVEILEAENSRLETFLLARQTPVVDEDDEFAGLTSSQKIEAMKPEGWDDEPFILPEDEIEDKSESERIEAAVQDDLEDEAETEVARTELQRLIDQYTAEEEDKEEFVEASVKTFKRDYTPPFVIDQKEYAWSTGEAEDYSKITLTYYPSHRILLDDDDEPIENVAEVVGWRSLSQFGRESGDDDTVFVRNPRLLTDFEVVRENDEQPPLHVTYGMSKAEFETKKAAGFIKFRPEDQ